MPVPSLPERVFPCFFFVILSLLSSCIQSRFVLGFVNRMRFLIVSFFVLIPLFLFAGKFEEEIVPLLKNSCLKCHGGEKTKGKVDFMTVVGAMVLLSNMHRTAKFSFIFSMYDFNANGNLSEVVWAAERSSALQ